MNELVNPLIKHDRYNKISDDIYMIGHNAMLKMNVSLYSNSENYGKISYHKEFEYYDQVSQSNMITMKRGYDYYLSIENMRSIEGSAKEFIRIGMREIMLVRQAFNAAVTWFTSKEYEDIYAYSKNKLIMARKTDPIEINNLPMGKFIILEPIIVEYNEQQDRGVRVYLSSSGNYADLSMYNFMGLTQTLNDVNMILCAQSMLTYLGRPEFGTNMHSFTDARNNSVNEGELVTGKTGRQIPKNGRSFFDKLEN